MREEPKYTAGIAKSVIGDIMSSDIKLNSKDKVDLSVEAAKAGVKQAEVVTMETDYISLKERLRQKRLREQKEILQIASGAEDNVENSVKEVEADD